MIRLYAKVVPSINDIRRVFFVVSSNEDVAHISPVCLSRDGNKDPVILSQLPTYLFRSPYFYPNKSGKTHQDMNEYMRRVARDVEVNILDSIPVFLGATRQEAQSAQKDFDGLCRVLKASAFVELLNVIRTQDRKPCWVQGEKAHGV